MSACLVEGGVTLVWDGTPRANTTPLFVCCSGLAVYFAGDGMYTFVPMFASVYIWNKWIYLSVYLNLT